MSVAVPPFNSSSSPTESSYSRADWLSGYRSQRQEFNYWIEAGTGTIPPDLTGTLFRIGPGQMEVAGHPVHHPFDGDGMVNAIAFHQGRAYYHNRYVRTAGYEAEQAAGKPLYRGVFGTQKPGGWWANAFDINFKNIANTNVLYWGDRLWALWEAAPPHRLDPQTLATLGLDHLGGVLAPGAPFSAHPRIDPHCDRLNGQPSLVNFGVKAGPTSTLTIYECDRQGHCFHQSSHKIPGFAFIHDFAITPHYYVFFQNPIQFNPIPFLLGWQGAAQCIQFQPQRPTQIVLIPRYGQGEMQILPTDPAFVFHHANAFEEGDRLIIDSICYASFPQLDRESSYREVDFAALPVGQLRRFTLDLTAGTVTSTLLVERSCEFPVLHPHRVGQPYRYVYLGAAHQALGNAPFQGYVKVDLVTGQQQMWSAAPQGFTGEPNFIPRPGAIAEDDGWLIGLVYNAARQCSDLVILDAQDLNRGEIARLHLKHHIPYGLHGSFVEQCFYPASL